MLEKIHQSRRVEQETTRVVERTPQRVSAEEKACPVESPRFGKYFNDSDLRSDLNDCLLEIGLCVCVGLGCQETDQNYLRRRRR